MSPKRQTARDRRASAGSATCVIVGGSSGLGRCLAERFAAGGYALVLVSSDQRDNRALASDLALRFGVQVAPVTMDLSERSLDLSALNGALSGLPPPSGLLLAAGMNRSDDAPGQSFESFEQVTLANFVNVCKIICRLLPAIDAAGEGFIIAFGSVAGSRGRTRNAAYGAAKRALQNYFESLRHSLGKSKIVAQFYVLGYLDTNLAFGQKTPISPASPRALAELVYRRRFDDFGSSYYPRFWQPLCAVVKLLPWFVFRRLSF
jgi:short-subunit dehydrogenase